MIYEINGKRYDGRAFSIQYANDMMSGVLIDMPKKFIWFSDSVDTHADCIDAIEDAGEMEIHDLSDCDIDWTEKPHSWVFRSMVNYIVQSAEQLCIEACDE